MEKTGLVLDFVSVCYVFGKDVCVVWIGLWFETDIGEGFVSEGCGLWGKGFKLC